MSRHNDGFTLVEFLLGLALAAIISLSAYNLFWSSVKFDDRMRRVHDKYRRLFITDYKMSLDLENAVSLDLSRSYPGSLVFEGHPEAVSFVTQTLHGLKRVTYYSGNADLEPTAPTQIGRITNPSSSKINLKDQVEFLIRKESSLSDWFNGTRDNTSFQIVASGLKKDSWHCQYAPYGKELHWVGAQGIDYQDLWDEKILPMSVRCSFTVYDPGNKDKPFEFKRDFFLAPIEGNQ